MIPNEKVVNYKVVNLFEHATLMQILFSYDFVSKIYEFCHAALTFRDNFRFMADSTIRFLEAALELEIYRIFVD